MASRRWTGLSRLSGPRVLLGQEEVVRLPFTPQPPPVDHPSETVLAQRERAHAKLVGARKRAEGIARQAEALVDLLGAEKTAAVFDEAALAIERAEETYVAAEAMLSSLRIARETGRALEGGRWA